ncbi:MAG: C69 family dipeptidase [Bacteroidales bacterium]|nr:C69 family dipeptidase [Bacteroidales bacterium]
MKKRILIAALLLSSALHAFACTSFIVGKKASADGSVMVTYNDDSYGKFGYLCHYPAGKHAKGEMRKIYNWENGTYLGEIPEARETFNVIGNINQFQLCITETTFTGRDELVAHEGILDYGSLIYIALQRCKTAREAISLMTSLVDEYGYYSSGESFSICDKEEAWIMEMIGKGKGDKGAVWVAVRIPDDCISGHANQSRITTFPLNDKDNCIYSKDVISFARQKGYFSGKDEEFSFRDAYNPLDFSGIRACDARVWSFFQKHDKSMDQYLPYINGDATAPSMPLYIKVDHKISAHDLKEAMRNHYENTPLDLTSDTGAGLWMMPYRPSPLTFEDSKGNTYFNERPVSTQQTAFTLVSQIRSWLPDEIGGLMWYGCDDANMIAYVPVYCGASKVPSAFAKSTSNAVTFNPNSAFWICNMVSNMIYPRYSALIDDLRVAQNELESYYESNTDSVEKSALSLKGDKRIAFLNDQLDKDTMKMMDRWQQLAGYIIVKHNDMVVKNEVDGKFDEISDEKARVTRPGLSQKVKDLIGATTGDRYRN